MSSNLKTFSFAAVLCLFASLSLTFASQGLKKYQLVNEKVDKQKNILKVLDLLDTQKKYSNEEILKIYTQNVKEAWVDAKGALNFKMGDDDRKLFLNVKAGTIKQYAIPISGYGLWSTLYGYFALKGDGNTVAGITFYEHKETPGLGGECEAPWFQKNFVGKKITNLNDEFVSVGVFKGKVQDSVPSNKQANYVDGISGATITGNGIQAFLKSDLQRYEVFSKKLRQGDYIEIKEENI